MDEGKVRELLTDAMDGLRKYLDDKFGEFDKATSDLKERVATLEEKCKAQACQINSLQRQNMAVAGALLLAFLGLIVFLLQGHITF
jgi:hypothetical protein